MDIAEYKINDRVRRLFHIQTPLSHMQPFSQLFFTPIFPKLFWSHRDEDVQYIGFDSLIELDEVPFIESTKHIKGDAFTPRFFGGLSYCYPQRRSNWYASFKDRCFILPKHLIELRGNKIIYHRFALSESSFDNPLEMTSSSLPPLGSLQLVNRDDFPSHRKWIQQIKEVIDQLEQKSLRKVVLARQTQLSFNQELNPYHLLEHLQQNQKNASLFSFQFHPQITFLGASPENLFTRLGREIKSEALAGSCTQHDQQALFESQKDYREFSYVTDYLTQCFQALCCSFKKDKHQVVSLGYLNHLKAYYEGILLPELSDEHLVKRLHPTPAISGAPHQEAQKCIESIEPFDRGWYAAPLGQVSEHQTQFIVGIRSCLCTLRQMNLFTGCGIIKDSLPEKEWEELESKLSFYLNYFSLHV